MRANLYEKLLMVYTVYVKADERVSGVLVN